MSATILVYNSALRDEANGDIAYGVDTFYAILCTSSYTPNIDTHTKRSDVTNEITGATNYTSGGFQIPVSVGAVNTSGDYVDITIGPVTIPNVTASGIRKAVIFKRRGGAASADNLVCCVTQSADLSPSNASVTISAQTIRKDQ